MGVVVRRWWGAGEQLLALLMVFTVAGSVERGVVRLGGGAGGVGAGIVGVAVGREELLLQHTVWTASK